jgi:hypothetical protein
MQVVCPAGEIGKISPGNPSKEGGKDALGAGRAGLARFDTATCKACRMRNRCQPEGAKSGRTVSINTYESYMQVQRDRAQTPEGRQTLRRRVAVEHALANLMNLGMRKARYRGKGKVALQAYWTATAVNVRRLARRAT